MALNPVYHHLPWAGGSGYSSALPKMIWQTMASHSDTSILEHTFFASSNLSPKFRALDRPKVTDSATHSRTALEYILPKWVSNYVTEHSKRLYFVIGKISMESNYSSGLDLWNCFWCKQFKKVIDLIQALMFGIHDVYNWSHHLSCA